MQYSVINNKYIAYLSLSKRENGHLSTSGLKSDVNIVFLHPDFLKHAKISAIRVDFRQI